MKFLLFFLLLTSIVYSEEVQKSLASEALTTIKDLILYEDSTNVENASLLALHYYYGDAINKDRKKALKIAEKSYKFNEPLSMYLIANYIKKGLFLEKNEDFAEKLYHNILKLDLETSNCNLAKALIYQFGTGKIKRDSAKYIEYLERAALQNNNFAVFQYAYELSRNEKFINHRKAFKYFKMGAELGHRIAQNELALYYYYGGYSDLFKPDYDKCRFWLEKSLENNFELAQKNLDNLPKLNGL